MEQQMSITALSVVDDQNIPTDAVDLILAKSVKGKKRSKNKSRSKSPDKQQSVKGEPSNKSGKAKGKKPRSKSKSRAPATTQRPTVDILDPVAMENLSYIAHKAQDALTLRGFPWPGAKKKKKGNGSAKGKKGKK